MANNDVPHGFNVWGELLRARYYAIPTAPTINICIGDMVMEDLGGIISAKLGLGHAVYDAAVIPATPGDATKMIGAVLACFDEDMDPVQYIAPAEAGDATVAGYVLVADHPYQQFEAQANAAITTTSINLNYEILSATLSAGDTYTKLSTQEIYTTGAAVTNTIPIRLCGQAYPLEDVSTAAGCRMICQINPECHLYGAGTMI